MGFVDRQDAGRRLADLLGPYRADHPIILALPRGGLPVAAEIARALDAPLDLVLVRKIGVPQQPELAAGAVVDDEEPIIVRNEDVISMADISETDFNRIKDAEIAENRRRRAIYLGNRPHPELRDRTVIVVDDGVATGATMRAALRALRKRHPRLLVFAVPVAPTDTIERLRSEADRVECLESHVMFDAIGTFYQDFRQIEDAEVIDLLSGATPAPSTATRP
ncbi:phosphoribosyltransferase [Devosia nitrariae]|uniref:Phosphoribosyltransferase n=1 Tax=Devosia nitrariae TaxID=2071872 RepID=A0ABQ5W8Z5_9HYPH|nr:phosphoribosyltransferase [Devosia nitrariae]GLQ56585.1 phosphoribosyltransferase [Devosia nitrariae]